MPLPRLHGHTLQVLTLAVQSERMGREEVKRLSDHVMNIQKVFELNYHLNLCVKAALPLRTLMA